MSFGGCIGEMPAVAAAAGAAVGLACGAIPAVTELVRRDRPSSVATSLAALLVFVALAAAPWASTWRALAPGAGVADTIAWWAAVFLFGVAAATIRTRWPRASALIVASTIGVGAWQGYGFRGGCAGNDPIFA